MSKELSKQMFDLRMESLNDSFTKSLNELFSRGKLSYAQIQCVSELVTSFDALMSLAIRINSDIYK